MLRVPRPVGEYGRNFRSLRLRLLTPGMVKLGRFDPDVPLLGFLIEGMRLLLIPGMVKLGRFDPDVPLVVLRGICRVGNRLALLSPLTLRPRIPELAEPDRDAFGEDEDRLDTEFRGVVRLPRCLDEDRLDTGCLEAVEWLELRELLVLAGALGNSCARIVELPVTFLGVSAARAGPLVTVADNRTLQAATFVILPSIVVAP